MSKNITTPWTFQDGREYIVSLTIVDHPSVNASLSLKLTDKITAEEWSCGFDAKYVENLTQKTGSFKPFNVFIAMVQSALLKKSDSVALDLMNFSDLENLRSQKGQGQLSSSTCFFGGKCNQFNYKHNGDLNSSVGSDTAGNGCRDKCQNNESGSSKKKFLIIQYSAEFDKVHYPIPLNYSGPPNLKVMQRNILQLKSEVVALRNAKSALEEEVCVLKHTQIPGFQQMPSCNEGMKNSNFFCSNEIVMNQLRQNQIHQKLNDVDFLDCESGKRKDRCPEDQMLLEKLAQRLSNLEDKLNAERADHLGKIDTLQAENDFLRRKLEASVEYEQRLEDEIFHLTNNGARLPSRTRPGNVFNAAAKGSGEMKRKLISKPLNMGSAGDNVFTRGGRGKTSLAYLGRRTSPGISPLPRRSRSFSPSPSRPSFDPTAYIREKKLKQEIMAQLRLDKIKSQLRPRDSSSSSGDGKDNDQRRGGFRTRSISRERESSPRINGLLRGRSRPSSIMTSNRQASRSPHAPSITTSQTKHNRKLNALYKEIDDRLRAPERHQSLSQNHRNGMTFPSQELQEGLKSSQQIQKNHKSQIPNPISLHARVDNLMREEFPMLGKSSDRDRDRVSRKNNVGVVDLHHDDIVADHRRPFKPLSSASTNHTVSKLI